MNLRKMFSITTLTFVFALLVFSFQNFSSISSNYEKIKIVDSSNGDIHNYQFTYAYAPSMILDKDAKTIHAFFCSTGNTDFGIENWDTVRYSVSRDKGRTWSVPKIAVKASNGVTERAACDPSVIYFDGYYYMYYSGSERNVQTVVFVARSKTIEGPYLKFTNRRTWESNPHDPMILIRPRKPAVDGTHAYGAGQTTVVSKDGRIHLWHNDDSAKGHDTIYYQTTTNPVVLTQGVQTNVSTPDLSAGTVDVKFDPVQNRFVMYSIRLGHYKSASIVARYSTDGRTWSGQNIVCNENCTPDFISNIGALGSIYGYLMPGNFLAYGAPYDLRTDCATTNTGHDVDRNCWGQWDIYGAFYSDLNQPGGQVLGHIDSLTNTATGFLVGGWACAYGTESSIAIHAYAKDPRSQARNYLQAAVANQASSDTIGKHCGTKLKKHRFSFLIPKSKLAGNTNAQIQVYGISPHGLQNSAITNSGAFQLPDGQIKGYLDRADPSGNGNVRLRGWACAGGLENNVGLHVYVRGPDGKQTFVYSAGTSIASDAAVKSRCQNFNNKNRYDITIPASRLAGHKGKTIYIYGISPIGLNNNSLANSGRFKVP